MKEEFNLNDRIYNLLRKEPFYARLSLHIDKQVSERIPTAAVGITKEGNFRILYNKKWMSTLTDEQVHGVLRHEFDHIVLNHVVGRGPHALKGKNLSSKLSKEEGRVFKIWNIATDLAINSNILRKRLPDNACIPGEGKFVDIKSKLSAEQYYQIIKNWPAEEIDKLVGHDDHSMWGEVSESVAKLAERKFSKAISDAIDNANVKGWGTVSQEMKKELEASLVSHVDWKKILRYFIRASIKSSKKSTYTRINKRFPYLFPGKKSKRIGKIAVALDESGSVSDKFFQQFWSELQSLSDLVTFIVVPFDSKVVGEHVFEWKKRDKIPARRAFGGGTNFQAPVDWANEHELDGLIIMSDLQASYPTLSKTQRLWITDKNNYERCRWKEEVDDSFAIMI